MLYRNEKKTTFATVQTANQQLTKRTDFLHFNPANSRANKLQKQFNNQSTKFRKKTQNGDVRKLQSFIRLVVGYTTGMEKWWQRGEHSGSEVESLPVEHKRSVRRGGGYGDTATHKKNNSRSYGKQRQLGQRDKNSIKSQMAIATGPTKRSGQQATFVLEIDREESNTTRNINRELMATSEETDKFPEETDQVPISITPVHPNEWKLSDFQVIEVDLTTTEDMESD